MKTKQRAWEILHQYQDLFLMLIENPCKFIRFAHHSDRYAACNEFTEKLDKILNDNKVDNAWLNKDFSEVLNESEVASFFASLTNDPVLKAWRKNHPEPNLDRIKIREDKPDERKGTVTRPCESNYRSLTGLMRSMFPPDITPSTVEKEPSLTTTPV